jgi:hypothetical protein
MGSPARPGSLAAVTVGVAGPEAKRGRSRGSSGDSSASASSTGSLVRPYPRPHGCETCAITHFCIAIRYMIAELVVRGRGERYGIPPPGPSMHMAPDAASVYVMPQVRHRLGGAKDGAGAKDAAPRDYEEHQWSWAELQER